MVTLDIPIRIRVDCSCEVMPRWYVIAKHFSSSIVGTIRGTGVRWRCFLNQVPTSRLLLRCGKTRNRVSSGQATFRARSDLSCARPFDGQIMPSALQPAERIMP